ncbi:MAG TPA: thioesterase family protein [Opitutaceae bacterium]|nr:thioesterase family protein [Opitutaceae bacterium]
MPFSYLRTVHFADTDAAGVVFFPNYLAICHEAYEEALTAGGIDLKTFFSATATVVPVTKSEAEYLRPLTCGDKLRVTVAPAALSDHSYELRFEVTRLGAVPKLAARVRTEHVCISAAKRERTPLPPALAAWVRAG